MGFIVELILKYFFSSVVYPLAYNIAIRRENDEEFKKKSDEAYGEVRNAKTTEERKLAARKLYELQKNRK